MMSIVKKLIPAPVEIGREAIIVIGGAVLAALVIGYVPGVRAWIKKQWNGVDWQ